MAIDTKTNMRGKLPEDFPGREALAANDITTYGGVRSAGDLTQLEGIGPATAEKITAAMNGDDTEAEATVDSDSNGEVVAGESGSQMTSRKQEEAGVAPEESENPTALEASETPEREDVFVDDNGTKRRLIPDEGQQSIVRS